MADEAILMTGPDPITMAIHTPSSQGLHVTSLASITLFYTLVLGRKPDREQADGGEKAISSCQGQK